jgi:hypothetical protein
MMMMTIVMVMMMMIVIIMTDNIFTILSSIISLTMNFQFAYSCLKTNKRLCTPYNFYIVYDHERIQLKFRS